MAIASPLNLIAIRQGVRGLGVAVTRAQVSANRSAGILLNRTKIKSKLVFGDRRLFQNRRDSVRRKRQESIVEASSIGGAIRSGATSIANTAKGFLGRIMDFLGTLLLGWMLNNLPTIISMAQELMGRIQRLVSILGSFVTNIGRSILSFGKVLGAIGQNIASFDFFDTSNRVENAMSELNSVFDDMGKEIDEGMKLLGTPLTEGLVTGEDAAPFGTDYTTQPGSPGQDSPEMYRIAAALSTEGTGSQSSADMMQVVVNRKATGKYGATYTDILAAPGQFAGVQKRPGGAKAFRKIQTIEDAAKWSGQSKDTLLKIIRDIQNQTLQQNAAQHVKGALEFRASAVRYPRLPGSAWRGGSGDNQFLLDPNKDPIRKEGASSFNLPAPVQAQITPSPGRGVTTTVRDEFKGRPGGAAGIITSERGMRRGRMHRGIDIAPAGPGYYVALKMNGTVSVASIGYNGGFGNYVDIKSGNIVYRFAHLARIFVRQGQSYTGQTIGEIGTTGRSDGIHLHYEVLVNGKDIDPRPYLGLLSIGRQLTGVAGQPAQVAAPGPTPAQVATRPTQRQQLPGQLTPERRGTQVVVIDDTPPPSIPQIPSAPSSGMMLPIRTGDSLNSFIKNKLLLDLAYT